MRYYLNKIIDPHKGIGLFDVECDECPTPTACSNCKGSGWVEWYVAPDVTDGEPCWVCGTTGSLADPCEVCGSQRTVRACICDECGGAGAIVTKTWEYDYPDGTPREYGEDTTRCRSCNGRGFTGEPL